MDAGYVVVPVNHDLIARRRGPARKKDAAACSTGCEPELDHASLLDGCFGRQEQQVVGDHGVPARLTDLRHER